jgi:hypothetical protein
MRSRTRSASWISPRTIAEDPRGRKHVHSLRPQRTRIFVKRSDGHARPKMSTAAPGRDFLAYAQSLPSTAPGKLQQQLQAHPGRCALLLSAVVVHNCALLKPSWRIQGQRQPLLPKACTRVHLRKKKNVPKASITIATSAGCNVCSRRSHPKTEKLA